MKFLGIFFELVLLLLGSAAVGYVIGVVQHYVVFGVHGYGFGSGPFELALTEGGFVGVMFGLPTGLFAYYVILRRRVTPRQVAIIVLGSLGAAWRVELFSSGPPLSSHL
jgi:hypothetical protein